MTPVLGTTRATMSPQEAAQHRKLTDAAQQFEAMFLNEMLKNSMSSSDDGNGDSADSGGQNGTIQGLGTESVAKAIAASGGLGIARHIVAEVEKEHAAQQGPEKNETPLKSPSDPPMKSL